MIYLSYLDFFLELRPVKYLLASESLHTHFNSSRRMASSSSALFDPSQSPNYGFTVPDAPSPNMRALLAYFDALRRWNFKDVMACFDEALEHRILPQSLSRPVLSKRQYGEYFKAIMPLINKNQVLRFTWSHHPPPFANKYWHSPLTTIANMIGITQQITIHQVIEAGDKMTVHVRTSWGFFHQ